MSCKNARDATPIVVGDASAFWQFIRISYLRPHYVWIHLFPFIPILSADGFIVWPAYDQKPFKTTELLNTNTEKQIAWFFGLDIFYISNALFDGHFSFDFVTIYDMTIT